MTSTMLIDDPVIVSTGLDLDVRVVELDGAREAFGAASGSATSPDSYAAQSRCFTCCA